MSTIKRDFVRPWSRQQVEEEREQRQRMRRMGMDPAPPEPAPLPAPTSKASRPDLYDPFARGVNSARKTQWRDDVVAGRMTDDTNVMPNEKLAENGVAADQPDDNIDRHGHATRSRLGLRGNKVG